MPRRPTHEVPPSGPTIRDLSPPLAGYRSAWGLTLDLAEATTAESVPFEQWAQRRRGAAPPLLEVAALVDDDSPVSALARAARLCRAGDHYDSVLAALIAGDYDRPL